MSTTVVYASGESGRIRLEGGITYLDAARNNGSITTSGPATTSYPGQNFAAGDYYCYQSFLLWDTSAVGTDSVSNVDFDVDGETDASDVDYVVEGYAFTWSGGGLTDADARDSDAGIPALGSIISSYDTTGGWTTTAGYNQTMGALSGFNAAINGSGNTEVVLISNHHRTETAPTGSEYVIFQCTGNTNDARLTITHAASVTLTYAKPDSDISASGWATAPLWSKVDDPPDTPDATVVTGTAS